jgi:predicted NAD-dependent protein-ADP-ribosyltransferase YbiA (DUF1768 family)
VAQAVEFLTERFGDRFVHLGTLTDMGIAYFLNSADVFVGFYPDGVRANNTTFNTAMMYQKVIVSNLDEDSPPEVRGQPSILDIDRADPAQLRAFLLDAAPNVAVEASKVFTWEELVRRIRSAWASDHALAA